MNSCWQNSTIIGLVVLLVSHISLAQSLEQIDNDMQQYSKKVQAIMQHFQVPGAAIGIIKDGQIIQAKGYGVLTQGKPEQVNADTIFKIASNTKAFTTAALALLVDQGKLSWDGKVQAYLPDFQLYDPWVTQHFTVKDLLTHRSGLGLGAGDLMLWPEPSSFTRQEVLHNLRFLKPTGEFRADYAYDNLLYIVAGELIPAVSGLSWEAFVEQRIMQPLGMNHCFAGPVNLDKLPQVATPHGMIAGRLQTIIRPIDREKPSVSGPAGGIQCSLNDMLSWVNMQLSAGKKADGQVLLSAKQHNIMWQPHTIMPLYASSKKRDNSHFSAYGLGWRINDMDGYLQIHHTGSLAGMYSFVSLFPELNLGFVVLTNQQSSAARSALMYTTMKPYLGDTQTDWLAEFASSQSTAVGQTQEVSPETLSKLTLKSQGSEAYIGAFDDPWIGRFIIEGNAQINDGALQIRALRIEKFVGDLYQQTEKDHVLIRWHDRSLEADAIIYFKRNAQGQVSGMTLLPATPEVDFSYDFQDLDFIKLSSK